MVGKEDAGCCENGAMRVLHERPVGERPVGRPVGTLEFFGPFVASIAKF